MHIPLKLGFASVLAGALIAAGCASTRTQRPADTPFPIREYAGARQETERRLSEVTTDLEPRLRTGSPEERARAMQEIAAFLRRHIGPHADQVDVLYTYADKQAGPRYTETMRYEHREIEARIHFLEQLAQAAAPDVAMFRAKLTAFLNYMWGHMDTETNTIGALVVDNEMERHRQVTR